MIFVYFHFLDPYGNAIRFDKNGDSLGFYSIKNYRQNPETGLYEYATVGSWENSVLHLNTSIIQWPEPKLPNGKVPVSICSFECGPGERKEVIDDKSCCWVSLWYTLLQMFYPPSSGKLSGTFSIHARLYSYIIIIFMQSTRTPWTCAPKVLIIKYWYP